MVGDDSFFRSLLARQLIDNGCRNGSLIDNGSHALRARIGAGLEKQRLRRLEALRLPRIVDEQEKSDALLNVILPANAGSGAQYNLQLCRDDTIAVRCCSATSSASLRAA